LDVGSMICSEFGKFRKWVAMAALLNSLNATTSNPALSSPSVSPPHPENRERAFILIGLQFGVQ